MLAKVKALEGPATSGLPPPTARRYSKLTRLTKVLLRMVLSLAVVCGSLWGVGIINGLFKTRDSDELEPKLEVKIQPYAAPLSGGRRLDALFSVRTALDSTPRGELASIPVEGPGNATIVMAGFPNDQASIEITIGVTRPYMIPGDTTSGETASGITPRDVTSPGAPLLFYMLLNRELDLSPILSSGLNVLISAEPLTAMHLKSRWGFGGNRDAETSNALKQHYQYLVTLDWFGPEKHLAERYDVRLYFRKPLLAAIGLSRLEWLQGVECVSSYDESGRSYETNVGLCKTESSVAFKPDFDSVNVLGGQSSKDGSSVYISRRFAGMSEVNTFSASSPYMSEARLAVHATSTRRKDIADFLLFALAALFGAASASLFDLVMGSLKFE